MGLRTDAAPFGRLEGGGPDLTDPSAGQRPRRRRDPRPPHAGRDAHGLVQERVCRRSAGPVGHRAFPRTPDVQGNRSASGRGVLEGRLGPRRSGERVHVLRLHGVFPAGRAAASRPHDGVSRPTAWPASISTMRWWRPSATWCWRSGACGSRPTRRPQLSEAMAAALFVHHPYGIPIIGWMHEIEALDRTHALDYYRRFYCPDNAILVVAGDVTDAEGAALGRRHLRPQRAPWRTVHPCASSRTGASRLPARAGRRSEGRAADAATPLSRSLVADRGRTREPRARSSGRGAWRRSDVLSLPQARAG